MSGLQIFFLIIFCIWMAVSLFLTIAWCVKSGLTVPCMPSEVYDYYIRDAILKEEGITQMPDEKDFKVYRIGSILSFIILIIINPIYVLLHSVWFIFNRDVAIEEYVWICYDNGWHYIIKPVKSEFISYNSESNSWKYRLPDSTESIELRIRPFARFESLMEEIEVEDE